MTQGGWASTIERARQPRAVVARPETPAPSRVPKQDGRSKRSTPDRDPFLDLIRALSITRVIVWHAFGFAAITYLASPVPALFVVSGALVFRSVQTDRRIVQVVASRLRRIVVPLWLFGLTVGLTIRAVWLISPSPSTQPPSAIDTIAWFFPIRDPKDAAWLGGWAASPLWFLRVSVQLLLLAPLLVWTYRRVRLALPLVMAALAFAIEIDTHWSLGYTPTSPHAAYLAGDVLLFGAFFVVGFGYSDNRLESISRRTWAISATAMFVVGAVYGYAAAPGHVVNSSHIAHGLVGGAYLCLAMAARPWLTEQAARPRFNRTTSWVNARSLSIYLWHSPIIFGLYMGASTLAVPHWLAYALVLPLTAPLLIAVVIAVSPLERHAHRVFAWFTTDSTRATNEHTGRGWPAVFRPVIPLLTIGLTAACGATTSGDPLAQPTTAISGFAPSPSRQPSFVSTQARAVYLDATSSTGDATSSHPTALFSTPAASAIGATVAQVTNTYGSGATASTANAATPLTPSTLVVSSVAPAQATTKKPLQPSSPAASTKPATTKPTLTNASTNVAQSRVKEIARAWISDSGESSVRIALQSPRSKVMFASAGDPQTPLDTWSITKTFTAAITWKLVAAGTLTLDSPVTLDAVPELPAGKYTVRHLLFQTSGIRSYLETDAFRRDQSAVDSPVAAIRVSLAEGEIFAPGSKSEYSSTNYLILGLLVEQTTGRSYYELFNELIVSGGLTATKPAQPQPGHPNFSTGGARSTLSDLLTWGDVYLRRHVGIPDDLWKQAVTADPKSSFGGGVQGYFVTDDGFDAIGFNGATAVFLYSRSLDSVVVVEIPSLWNDESESGYQHALQLISNLLTAVARGEL